MRILADECCPRVVVDQLRSEGHDVRYAAETDRRAADIDLLSLAVAERRVVVTEDFDYGVTLMRQRPGAACIILFMPKLAPQDRAARLRTILADQSLSFADAITIIEPTRIRQRRISLPTPKT